MKKYVFEAAKKQWEKPTEPKYVFCPFAQVTVLADSDEEALEKADKKLREEFHATGFLLGETRLVESYELAVDWNYGYGDGRLAGTAEEKAALWQSCTK